MIKIRLMRIGGRQRPFYRVVAINERSKRTGGYLELLGTYDPLTTPHDIKLKQDRIDYWLKLGAQPSDGYLRMIGKAPQRPPRKPKKEKKSAPAPQPTEAAAPTEEPKAEESTPEAPTETTEKPSEPKVKTEPDAEPTTNPEPVAEEAQEKK